MRENTPRVAARKIRDAIEQLINLIDVIDGDADCEDNGDVEDAGDAEPSLGAPENHPSCIPRFAWNPAAPYRDHDGAQVCWANGARDDREGEHDGRESDVDDELSGDEEEPSLGSFDRFVNQEHGWRQTEGPNWSHHRNEDLEAEPPMT